MALNGSVAAADSAPTQTVTITVTSEARTITAAGTVEFTVKAGEVLFSSPLTTTSTITFLNPPGQQEAMISAERDGADLARLRLEISGVVPVDSEGCLETDVRADDGTECTYAGPMTGGWYPPENVSWTGVENDRFVIWQAFAAGQNANTHVVTWRLIGGANVEQGVPLAAGEMTTAIGFIIEDADLDSGDGDGSEE
jgi:hypothetical protein